MNKRVGNNINSKKAPLYPQNGKKMELRGGKSGVAERTMPNRRKSARERKLALLQDVDNLKKKLRHEENVHKALERAFNRPLGALPRLPPYLPQYTLELLAEVAVLEEEVVRLEEQIVKFRQGLYQEAVCMSSRKDPEDLNEFSIRGSKRSNSRSPSHSEVNLGQSGTPLSRIASTRKFLSADRVSDGLRHCSEIKQPRNEQNLTLENGLGIETRSSANSDKDKSCQEKKSLVVGTHAKRRLWKPESLIKSANSPKMQCRIVQQAPESSSGSSDDRVLDIESEANKMSEDILKCLISIFVRLSSSKGKTMDFESFSSLAAKTFNEDDVESKSRDPYCNFSEFKTRDIGSYKDLYVIEAHSVDLNRKTRASFLIRRLKLLLDKLSSVKLDGLNHQQKLAFWINIYNSCIMNAFLEHGIPDSPDMIMIQMQKATIKVGGHVLKALMIEHLILRLPYHLKYTYAKSAKNDERKFCRTLGLEWSEPLVTFALSCGSWSSPAVRVYTASQIETELETAKRDYLQAAIGISSTNNLVIPKLLDWYLLDFAKDMDALLDWICLQLPDELRNEAVKCLERRGKEPLSKLVQVMPYNFSFRYLVCL
ncbi:hypothetical protein CDL12_09091 [Handroanthus impetiginosus]|uniref:Ternary complex factor MIP1 leucine-zipper domain-containing protein n=1 Tax=Handroanthus impetiginosus TaxID=429701 RepID=A0A2G9HL39_9LAMI|nr:hypothetical protein CDL12_09091 [Handroanthus impetiginosus]